jgi:hypothetical protein
MKDLEKLAEWLKAISKLAVCLGLFERSFEQSLNPMDDGSLDTLIYLVGCSTTIDLVVSPDKLSGTNRMAYITLAKN